jgi:penicillin-binding protein 1A
MADVFERFVNYCNGTYGVEQHLRQVKDGRVRPRYGLPGLTWKMMIGIVTGIRSMNQLAEAIRDGSYDGVAGTDRPSADTFIYAFERVDRDSLVRASDAIKPILYAAALEAGHTPATMVEDEPLTLKLGDGKTWQPENYDRRYRGNVTLREGLEESINIVAVKLLQQIGPRAVVAYGQRLGISTFVDKGGKNDLNASLALGGLTKGVTPLELTAAYAPFANGGVYTAPYAISRVEDSDGVVLYEAKTVTRTAMSDALAFVMTDMMRGVIERGTGRRAAIGRPAAGKTGTTSDYTNAWFTGYTPQLVATIWIGNDLQREPMTSATGNIGSAKAAEIWASFMKQALAGHPVEDFRLPQSGLVGPLAIDRSNGLLVPQGCQLPSTAVTQEYFIEASAPQAISPRCR